MLNLTRRFSVLPCFTVVLAVLCSILVFTFSSCSSPAGDDGGDGGKRNWVVSTLAGDGTQGNADGPNIPALFSQPNGVAVDSAGNVYVADTGNHRIRKVSPAGQVTTLAGSGVAVLLMQ